MKEIYTKSGQTILVDDEDYAELSKTWWSIHEGYVRTNEKLSNGKLKSRLMHRIIMGTEGTNKSVDHINGNKQDNRKSNLRVCTHAENCRNRSRHRGNKTGFKGVSFKQQKQQYVAQICHKGRVKHLGYFDSPELAHEFYCLAADMLHGEFANYG